MGPGDLAQALCGLTQEAHPAVLVGLDRPDDAGVYRLRDDLALIQTMDFFTPIVDEPELFGRIAAANALSDVYAMGGQPICAMNIVCFPIKTMDIEVLRAILRGGLACLKEAGVPLLGGHSVDDKEVKYGLSVSGTVHPERLWTNHGARPGDALVLTKPLGTGVISTAVKRGQASAAAREASEASMATLNRGAADVLRTVEVHACTDITGFGLVGHVAEMIAGREVGLVLDSARVPLLPGALDYARLGLTPGGLKRNRSHCEPDVQVEPGVVSALVDLLYDPQTSGGLLAAVAPADAALVLERLKRSGAGPGAIVGAVVGGPGGTIAVR